MSTGDFPAEDFTPERVKANPELMAHPDVAALVAEAEHWRQAYAQALPLSTAHSNYVPDYGDLSPEDAQAVDDAVERMRAERGYPAPTPAGDLLRALRDPLGYWEERAAAAEAKVAAVQRILAATYYNPAKALSDIRKALT